MQPASARALRGDDNEMSREAVLLQWERKIEAAERRAAGASCAPRSRGVAEPIPLRLAGRRPASSRSSAARPPSRPPSAGRSRSRGSRRPRAGVAPSSRARPADRIALWAFLLGLLLVAVAPSAPRRP